MEMAETLALDMIEKNLLTDQIVLWIGYDTENLKDPQKFAQYSGKINLDFYGRKVPEGARGSLKLTEYSNSSKEIIKAALGLFDRISNKGLTIRKLNISANNIIDYENYSKNRFEQISFFFSSYDEREKRIREATMKLSKRYGKNAVLYGYNLRECATGKERNEQIGGHKA